MIGDLRSSRALAELVDEADLRASDCGFAPGLPLYAIVLGLAFVSPLAAVILTLALAAFYLPSASLYCYPLSSARGWM